MAPIGDDPYPGWAKIYPPYCEHVLIHDAPMPIMVVLHIGQADLYVNGIRHPMHEGIVVTVQGRILIHNTNEAQAGIPPTGKGQEIETTVYYKHLD